MISKYKLSCLLLVAKEYELYTMIFVVQSEYSTIQMYAIECNCSIMNELKECNDNDTACFIFILFEGIVNGKNSRDTSREKNGESLCL